MVICYIICAFTEFETTPGPGSDQCFCILLVFPTVWPPKSLLPCKPVKGREPPAATNTYTSILGKPAACAAGTGERTEEWWRKPSLWWRRSLPRSPGMDSLESHRQVRCTWYWQPGITQTSQMYMARTAWNHTDKSNAYGGKEIHKWTRAEKTHKTLTVCCVGWSLPFLHLQWANRKTKALEIHPRARDTKQEAWWYSWLCSNFSVKTQL